MSYVKIVLLLHLCFLLKDEVHVPILLRTECEFRSSYVQMVTEIFGELLYYPETDLLSEFPSPESLKGRILISTKPPIEYLDSKSCDEEDKKPKSTDKGSQSPDVTNKVESDDKVSIEMKTLVFLFGRSRELLL